MISSSIDPRDQLLDLLSCQNFDLSVGYPQIKSEPKMFVILSYSWIFLEHTPLYLLFWPMLSLVHIIVEFHPYGKFRWLVVEPISSILSHPCFVLNIQLVLETFISIIFMSRAWSICSDERSDLLKVMGIWCKLPPWIWESQCCLLWNHLKSVMHVLSMLWFDRLATSILFVSLAHLATDWFVQGKGVDVQILVHAQDSDILDDGFPPELGSVLL